jgi:hypothetical protein
MRRMKSFRQAMQAQSRAEKLIAAPAPQRARVVELEATPVRQCGPNIPDLPPVKAENLVPQVELKAQSIRDFINSPLISNQIAGRRNHCRLPPVSLVFANLNIDVIYSQRRNDHLG